MAGKGLFLAGVGLVAVEPRGEARPSPTALGMDALKIGNWAVDRFR